MSALVPLFCLIILCAFAPGSPADVKDNDVIPTKKVELRDGLYIEIPEQRNATDKVMSIGIDIDKSAEEGRGKRKKLFARLLPLFIMPFILQSTLVPIFLGALKFMLFKSLLVGKLALTLIVLNAFKNHNSFKGRKDEVVANVHYGYHGDGMNEYGAYFN